MCMLGCSWGHCLSSFSRSQYDEMLWWVSHFAQNRWVRLWGWCDFVPEVRSPNGSCPDKIKGLFFLVVLGKRPFPSLFQLLEASHIPWFLTLFCSYLCCHLHIIFPKPFALKGSWLGKEGFCNLLDAKPLAVELSLGFLTPLVLAY